MAYRVLEVTLQSAKDLRKVNLMTRMEVYAVATISGDPITRQCTPPDPYGGRNPTWNATLRFAIPPDSSSASSGCLHVLLRTARSLGDRDVGEVIVPLSDILHSSATGSPHGSNSPQSASYQVRKVHRAEARGVLHLSYRLGPVLAPQDQHHQQPQPQRLPVDEQQHVVAYPAVPRPFYPQPYAYYLPPALLPPSPRESRSGGYMALPAPPLPPSPRSYDHTMDLPPPPPPLHKAYNGQLSMPPPPATTTPQPSPGHKAAMEPATPPPKASSGYASAAASPAWTPPPKASGYSSAAALPWATTPTAAKNSGGGSEFGAGAPVAGGRMMSSDMMADAAAYNAGYRAALAADWRRGGTLY
ncbi:protein SRC2 [Brachypodium distachyon]|uniref:protein SRC2 n=1 Tax=Brachypodium distachyon TaxID=15368 RepID=UPI0001C75691|nr:protein SRC2 [Brachypodium distachyon]|eukprot:XP_003559819.1 protein SRC2 [Brachypodium distachyon]